MEYARWRKHATNDETNAKNAKRKWLKNKKNLKRRAYCRNSWRWHGWSHTVPVIKKLSHVEIKEEAVDPE